MKRVILIPVFAMILSVGPKAVEPTEQPKAIQQPESKVDTLNAKVQELENLIKDL